MLWGSMPSKHNWELSRDGCQALYTVLWPGLVITATSQGCLISHTCQGSMTANQKAEWGVGDQSEAGNSTFFAYPRPKHRIKYQHSHHPGLGLTCTHRAKISSYLSKFKRHKLISKILLDGRWQADIQASLLAIGAITGNQWKLNVLCSESPY